jgi:hypothetical protein
VSQNLNVRIPDLHASQLLNSFHTDLQQNHLSVLALDEHSILTADQAAVTIEAWIVEQVNAPKLVLGIEHMNPAINAYDMFAEQDR